MNSLTGRLLAAFTLVIALTALLTVGIASQTTAFELRHAVDGPMMAGTMHMNGQTQIENGVHIMSMPVEAIIGRVIRAVGLSSGVAGVAAFAIALVVVQAVTGPLSRVADASRQVAAGDFHARAIVEGPAEIQSVALAFNRMAEEMEEQERMRQTLMVDVAHELRNPLTVLQGQIEALQDGVFPLTVEGLTPLHNQTLHLARLVEDVRTLAHADSGHLVLELDAVALRPLVAESLMAFSSEAVKGGIVLNNQVPETLPPLNADARRLRQVLDNLLSNALRHTPPGGIIQVTATPTTSYATIVISDTGDGIPPDGLPHLFDRFYRVDPSRSRTSGGSGLGLAIVKRLTESQGGTVTVESDPGKGTRFTLTLPFAANH